MLYDEFLMRHRLKTVKQLPKKKTKYKKLPTLNENLQKNWIVFNISRGNKFF